LTTPHSAQQKGLMTDKHHSKADAFREFQAEKEKLALAQGYSLAVAARDGDLEQVRELLKKGAPANWGDSTPLQWACQRGHPDCVRVLLNAKASFLLTHAHDGRNALHYACARGNMECVGLLLSKGAADDTQDLNGRKAFHLAYMNGHVDVVDLLTSAQAKMAAKAEQQEPEHGKTLTDENAIAAGNTRARALLNAHIPSPVRPQSGSAMKRSPSPRRR